MTEITRRQALGLLAAPLIAGCRQVDLLGPSFASSATDPVTLIGAGDVHAHINRTKGPIVRATAALVAAEPTATAFVVGDNAGVQGSTVEYGYYHQTWGGFKDRTLFVVGDHDYLASSTATPYYDYTNGAGGPRGKGYYAKTIGAWRCYFLNSHLLRGEQATWLAKDLPLYPHLHKLAVWHKPMFASVCAHHGKAMSVPFQLRPWWQVLQKHRAELVMVGHVHRYERFARLTWDGQATDAGIRQFIVGTGGGVKYFVQTPHPHSEQQIVEHGVFRLVLHADRYEWEFIDIAGVIRDSGSTLCRPLRSA
jgi:hypothetical protein